MLLLSGPMTGSFCTKIAHLANWKMDERSPWKNDFTNEEGWMFYEYTSYFLMIAPWNPSKKNMKSQQKMPCSLAIFPSMSHDFQWFTFNVGAWLVQCVSYQSFSSGQRLCCLSLCLCFIQHGFWFSLGCVSAFRICLYWINNYSLSINFHTHTKKRLIKT